MKDFIILLFTSPVGLMCIAFWSLVLGIPLQNKKVFVWEVLVVSSHTDPKWRRYFKPFDWFLLWFVFPIQTTLWKFSKKKDALPMRLLPTRLEIGYRKNRSTARKENFYYDLRGIRTNFHENRATIIARVLILFWILPHILICIPISLVLFIVIPFKNKFSDMRWNVSEIVVRKWLR